MINSKKAGKISKALADPHRLLILKEIKKQNDCLYCVALNDVVDLAQPSIAHHLKLLMDAELILSEKEGRYVKYKLNAAMLDEYVEFVESLKK
jgi:DNA-binding transcriptional ArsR family regulator